MTITAIALVTLGTLVAIAAKSRMDRKEAVVLVRSKKNRKR
ncbi:MAG: hypothetical protein OEV42_08200 [Deltaproteobacteria bacterium]|nr:hypothetical protein [Deltaproteobacteria bacterium]